MKHILLFIFAVICPAYQLITAHFSESTPYPKTTSQQHPCYKSQTSITDKKNTPFNRKIPTVPAVSCTQRIFRCSALEFKDHFAQLEYSDNIILSQHMLYESNEFIIFAKTLPHYKEYIKKLYKKLQLMTGIHKLIKLLQGSHYYGFTKRITQLYRELQKEKLLHKQQKNNNFSSHKKISDISYQQYIIDALRSSDNQEIFSKKLNTIVQDMYTHAYNKNIDVHTDIETCLDTSLDIIKNTENTYEFIFHTALVNYVATDMAQMPQQSNPSLFMRALEQFITHLNPIKQVKSTCEFLVSTAHFVADITLGKLYLTQEQYLLRKNDFWSSIDALSPSHLALLSREQIVDIAAQCAADCVFSFGIFKAARYVKNIRQMTSHSHKAIATVAQQFTSTVDIALSEKPILVTPEGSIIKSVEKMHATGIMGQEIISDSKALLTTIQNGLLAGIEKRLAEFNHMFEVIHTIGPFAHKKIKIDCKHIFCMEFNWGKKGKPYISGFHHDYGKCIENTNIFEFKNKITTKDGFYSAELLYGKYQLKPRSSFFPSHWSKKEVVNKIRNAYESFIKNNSSIAWLPNGKATVDILIENGISIRMHVTKNGFITSAYPILPKQ